MLPALVISVENSSIKSCFPMYQPPSEQYQSVLAFFCLGRVTVEEIHQVVISEFRTSLDIEDLEVVDWSPVRPQHCCNCNKTVT